MEEAAWNNLYAKYKEAYPELAAGLERRMDGELPADWDDVAFNAILKAVEEEKTVASRKASQMALNELAPHLPELVGGSADLTGSNLTNWNGVQALRADNMLGRHINYGVREFGMGAIMNGIALYGGFIPYGATFLTFSDYEKNAMRMAALMKLRTIFVYTHDSIGLGEDGPTHQPIEHLASLRLIPNMDVWRPADTVETVIAWESAIERKDGPTSLIFSRQNLPFMVREETNADDIAKGAYIDRQDEAYKTDVLGDGLPIVAIEAASTGLWWKYVKGNGTVIGLDQFGESAPAKDLFKLYGFTVENIVNTVKTTLNKGK